MQRSRRAEQLKGRLLKRRPPGRSGSRFQSETEAQDKGPLRDSSRCGTRESANSCSVGIESLRTLPGRPEPDAAPRSHSKPELMQRRSRRCLSGSRWKATKVRPTQIGPLEGPSVLHQIRGEPGAGLPRPSALARSTPVLFVAPRQMTWGLTIELSGRTEAANGRARRARRAS